MVAHEQRDEPRFPPVMKDSSERQHADDERRRLLMIAEHSPDFIAIIDPQGRSQFVNRAGRLLVGLDATSHIRAITLPEFFAAEDRRVMAEIALPAVMRDGSWLGELSCQHVQTRVPIPVLAELFRVDDPTTGELISLAMIARDVTDHKRADAQLQRNDATVAALIRNHPCGVYVVDADCRMRYVNVEARKMFAHVHPLLGRDVGEVLRVVWPERFAREAVARFRHTLVSGEPYAAPRSGERHHSREIDAHDWRIERIALPDGRNGVVCYVDDLNERQRGDAVLRDREERWRLAAEAARLGIWSWQPEGDRIVWENQRSCAIMGLSPADLPVTTTTDFVAASLPPEDRAAFDQALARTSQDGTPLAFEGRIRCHDGASRWVAFTGARVMAEARQPLRVIGTVEDVTERRHTEERLLTSEARFRSLAEGMPHCVWVCDAHGSNEYQNQVWYDYTGTPPGTGHGLTWIDQYHPDDRPYVWQEWTKALQTAGAHPYDIEVRLRRRDGVYRWFRIKGRPLKDATGATIRWIGTSTDIHEQRHLLQALRDADRRKDEFLATLAHELRNPLAPMTNALELMKQAQGNAALIEQARATMARQLGHMVRLVDDLLDVSRITLNKLELKRERVELASVVHHVVEAFRPDCERAAHDLHIALPVEPMYLHADPVRLAQVFGNLLTNAGKYTETGGRIWLTAESLGTDVVVRVKDTGIGIPPEMLPRVFDVFTQVGRSVERSQGGLGIGLSLVKRLVEMHGGRVTVHSDGAGLGSEFVVYLPLLIESPSVAPRPAPVRNPTVTTARRILIVDDNQDSVNILDMLLVLAGHETETAKDGVEAVDKAAVFRPDVILLDIGLPKMNGYETCRTIRAHQWGRDIMMVALTGWGQEEDRRKSEDAGFNVHMVKPIDHDALTMLLASLPQSRRSTSDAGPTVPTRVPRPE